MSAILAGSAARRGAAVLALLVAMGLACVDGAQQKQKAKQQSLRMASSEVRSASPPPAARADAVRAPASSRAQAHAKAATQILCRRCPVRVASCDCAGKQA